MNYDGRGQVMIWTGWLGCGSDDDPCDFRTN